MKFKLKYLALLPLFISFLIATISTLILGVLPVKYLILLIFAEILIFILATFLISRRHLTTKIISAVIIVLTTLVASVISYFLIVANININNFAEKSVVTTKETPDTDITNTPFILLVNGLDGSASNDLNAKANCDVNQMIAVNPNTHRILIVNTPRDYYVYLHGVTEMRDKLTHVGYYDVDMPRQTLEDLYGLDIDYYVRINFNTLINLVDLIGGIDIESEQAFDTTSHTHVKKGWNHFNGQEALAYSRERKHLRTGDIQRASDQQQVMIAIFDKLSHSPELLTNFSAILNSLQDSFQTDLDIAQVKKFVQIQLDTNPSWEIETTAVTGEAVMTEQVYSLPKTQKYYVVIPDEASLQNASKKLKSVLGIIDQI